MEQAEVHNVEDNAIVEALENKLLEYKERYGLSNFLTRFLAEVSITIRSCFVVFFDCALGMQFLVATLAVL